MNTKGEMLIPSEEHLKYSFTHTHLSSFGFVKKEDSSWSLSNWKEFWKVPGILKSEFILKMEDSLWKLEVRFQEKDGKISFHTFKPLNLYGVFFCIFFFVQEKCVCGNLDKCMVENFYLERIRNLDNQSLKGKDSYLKKTSHKR